MVTGQAMNAAGWSGFLGRKWAQNWRRTDRTFDNLAPRMRRIAEEEPFARVLDIGCGAGETAIDLATRHRECEVTGLDVCPELIAVAKERAAHLANVRFLCADAAVWKPDGEAAYDLVIGRHVAMFFDEPAAAFAHLASLATGDARCVFSCFRSNDENGWIGEILALLSDTAPQRIGAGKPSPLAFADPQWVEQLLRANGWADVRAEPVDFAMTIGEGEDPLAEATSYLLEIGPASFAADTFSPEDLDRFRQRMRPMLERHMDDGRVSLPGAGWIYSARRS